MSLPWSLRGRLLVGAALWTIGLFFLGIVLWHVTLGNRHPPALMGIVVDNAAVVAVLCAGLLVAGLLQVRRGWSPINQLRARLARLDAGVERRLDGEYPSEVAPLVGDLNALLDQRERSLARARAKAGDLAHGLKTPLAVLVQEADRADAAGRRISAMRSASRSSGCGVGWTTSWRRPGPTRRPRAAPARRRR